MAQRRMLSLQIVDTDAFLEMPTSSQGLYFHLVVRADDEGFVGNPKKVIKMIGCNEDDLKILIAKRFLLPFESGVVVIKHWLIHNSIRMDRFNPTAYQKEKSLITTSKNKAYTELATERQPIGNQGLPQVKLSQVNETTAAASAAPLSVKSFFDKTFRGKQKNDSAVPMSLADFVLLCRGSDQRHIRIIAEYADDREPDFNTRGQWREFGLRNMRVARRLVPYNDRQLQEAMGKLTQNLKENGGFITKWSLETLEKHLDEIH